MTARDAPPEGLAHLGLPPGQRRGELERRAEEPVVDGTQLDADARAADRALRRAETGHGSDHVELDKLRCDKGFVKRERRAKCGVNRAEKRGAETSERRMSETPNDGTRSQQNRHRSNALASRTFPLLPFSLPFSPRSSPSSGQ